MTQVETMVEPELADAPPCWPPLAHIIREEDLPVREGSIAVCGERMMGLSLGRVADSDAKICDKCYEIRMKELGL